MIQCNPSEAFCDAPEEGAALGLLGLMTGLSEECWCAGWMTGLEFSLWDAPPGMRFGQGRISKRQSKLLKLLSEECGGWWHWVDDHGAKFIRMDDWLKLLPEEAEGSAETEEQVRALARHKPHPTTPQG